MKNKTITFSIDITPAELEQAVAGVENPNNLASDDLIASLCKQNLRELVAKNEKKEAGIQIMQAYNDDVKVAEEQVEQKWDGKISVEIK